MASGKTVLLVEDEPQLVLGLSDALEFEGFEVLTAETGEAGARVAQQQEPDVILLDLMLPDRNGYQVCQEIREADPLVPIIMLTARSQEADKIRGLDAGADDYVTKPFGVGELVARIRAVLRRLEPKPRNASFKLGSRTVNLATHAVEIGDERLQLSAYEVELLRYLHERAGEAVSRDEILNRVWGVEATTTNRTIDNFIVKLRKKIEPRPDRPEHILTIYGYGYKLMP